MNGETTVSAAAQISVLLLAVTSGFAIGLYYDFFRLIRKIIRCGKISVMIQDIIFWITSAIVVFFQSISVNGGYVRIYFIITIILSWFFYFFTVGRIVMFMVNSLIELLKRLFQLLFKYIIGPLGRLTNRFFMLISQKITQLLTQMTKNTKMNKKC